MKVRVSFWRTFLTFIIATILLGAAMFFGFFNLFVKEEWDARQIVLIVMFVILSVTFLLLSYFQNYYEVNRKYVIQHKGRKEYIYYYSEILYIDEKQSEKKKVICFFTNKGHCQYLTFDKNGVLYRAMLEGAKNSLSTEDFKLKYPNVKL